MTITARAPMRIDFAGGTIDLPPLYLFHHPAPTVNAAVSVEATVTITPSEKLTIISRDQDLSVSFDDWQSIEWQTYPVLELVCRLVQSFQPDPVTIEIHSDAPTGSGLGGSSVLGIALTAALAKATNRSLTKQQIIDWTKSIETQAIKVPTGYQDYWAPTYGRVNAFQVELDGSLTVTPLGSEAFRKEVESQLMLVYVGKPHFSGANNWELFKHHIDNNEKTVAFFEQLKENGVAMQQAWQQEDLLSIAKVLNEDWRVRKQLLPSMTTPEIELLTEQAMLAGALAARVCGAGAGGCVLLIVPPEKQAAVREVVTQLAMQELPITFAEAMSVTEL